MKSTSTLILSLLCISAISAAAAAESPAPPNALMCTPGELIFSEDFDPETVSDRWGFKAEFALRDGALLRTDVDPTYRDLVAKRDKLQAALHADYAEAFASHKQLSKLLAKKKQHIKATEPEFKAMEIAVHRARRAEDAYVLSTKPELASLKEAGIPKQRFSSELGQIRVQLEAAGDKKLAALVAETARCQATLAARFPEAFESVDAAVEKRQAIRKSLNDDPEFQARNRAVVDAGKAIKDYEQKAAPNLAQLEAASKAYIDSLKLSNAR